MNISKLVLHNLTSPMHKRISRTDLAEKVSIARVRGTVLALAASIREELRPTIEARQLDEMTWWSREYRLTKSA